jgi:hypothetical protein
MRNFSHFQWVSSLLLIAAWIAISAPMGYAQQAVVVELFTSEGCSSCPPADALLSSLAKQRTTVKGVELILLGEHVEYWNDLGWRDRFSAPAYTERQYEYVRQLHLATAYTPQIVIDGHLQTSGGNAAGVQRLLAEAATAPKPANVSLSFVSSDKLRVTVTAETTTKLQVILAVTEDNLSTTVQGGENGGRVLKHDAVVRELHPLGRTTDGKFDKTVAVPHKADWKPEDLRVMVLVQESDSGAILGAASVVLPALSPTAALH